eukprot:7295528-Prymnesium_polylepis.1
MRIAACFASSRFSRALASAAASMGARSARYRPGGDSCVCAAPASTDTALGPTESPALTARR